MLKYKKLIFEFMDCFMRKVINERAIASVGLYLKDKI